MKRSVIVATVGVLTCGVGHASKSTSGSKKLRRQVDKIEEVREQGKVHAALSMADKLMVDLGQTPSLEALGHLIPAQVVTLFHLDHMDRMKAGLPAFHIGEDLDDAMANASPHLRRAVNYIGFYEVFCREVLQRPADFALYLRSTLFRKLGQEKLALKLMKQAYVQHGPDSLRGLAAKGEYAIEIGRAYLILGDMREKPELAERGVRWIVRGIQLVADHPDTCTETQYRAWQVNALAMLCHHLSKAGDQHRFAKYFEQLKSLMEKWKDCKELFFARATMARLQAARLDDDPNAS